ncbi:hypothetical protein [Stakelama saccharophila]|uniref:PepSY domain-containing protein n=1 Tax=Stakelama saccharophila TaxID=3075605 RepID=A0ABZ0BA33_9SPHN|nr:hypothetical protein [Stakelama sp. W311]WNO54135.1 hypothetical protein RPR59_02420 [Stakelama sp. W311]
MTMVLKSFLIAGALCGVAPTAAEGAVPQHRREDQNAALEGRRSGRILPVREIERRVLPSMHGAKYLGFDFDSATTIYTLKFLRDGSVIWVDVDGRSGHVLRRSDR